jgi:hypothetical protein
VEGLKEFEIGDPGKKVRIGSQLPQLVKEDLVAFVTPSNFKLLRNH